MFVFGDQPGQVAAATGEQWTLPRPPVGVTRCVVQSLS